MSDDERHHAVYLLQLHDDLDRLHATRWEWVPAGVMGLLAAAFSVLVLVEGVLPAGVALLLIAGATARHAVRTERERRAEVRAILDRIEGIEGRRLGGPGSGTPERAPLNPPGGPPPD